VLPFSVSSHHDGKKGKGGRKREDSGRVEVVNSDGCGEVIGDIALMFFGADLQSTWSRGDETSSSVGVTLVSGEMIRVRIHIRTCSRKC
jgi:hypothetical protein